MKLKRIKIPSFYIIKYTNYELHKKHYVVSFISMYKKKKKKKKNFINVLIRHI